MLWICSLLPQDSITSIAFKFSNPVTAVLTALLAFREEQSQSTSRILGYPLQIYLSVLWYESFQDE
jgi:hypothetical protein